MTFQKIKTWMAVSPAASYARAALATAAFSFLTDIQANLPNLGLHPVVAVLVASLLPVVLRALNPADGIFGKNETTVED